MNRHLVRAAFAAALVSLSGTAHAQLTATPTTFDFGTLSTGTAVTLTGQLKNVSTTGRLFRVSTVTRCAGTSAEFALPTNITGAIEPGQTRPFYVTYRPVDAGADAGCLELTVQDTVSPATAYPPIVLTLSGAGAGASIPRLVTGVVGFTGVALGTTATQTLTVQNAGAADLVIDAIALDAATSPEFAVAPVALPAVIPSSQSLALTVTYAPVDVGTDAGTLQITSNDPATPVRSVPVSGTGFDPTAKLDVDIAAVVVPSTDKARRPLALTVRTANVGSLSGTITIEVVAVQDGVEVYRDSLSPYSTAGEVVDQVGFGFTPRSKGTVTWTVTVTDGDADVDVATADTVVR